jgi:hypothetical protein
VVVVAGSVIESALALGADATPMAANSTAMIQSDFCAEAGHMVTPPVGVSVSPVVPFLVVRSVCQKWASGNPEGLVHTS